MDDRRGLVPCACGVRHTTRLIAVTGGPGAGKTAVLSVARHHFCNHVVVLPEAATMLFSGGFPRFTGEVAHRSAQRAIFSVQREIENSVASDGRTAVALCDRGTVDGLAYWPGEEGEFFAVHGTTREEQLARYAAVIHLRVPPARYYNHVNDVRIESAVQAQRIDERIAVAWRGHPRVHVIEASDDFLMKTDRALSVIASELPECCRHADTTAHKHEAPT